MSDNIQNLHLLSIILEKPEIFDLNKLKETFTVYHEQDCCESVYADFSVFETTHQDVMNL